MYQWAHIFPGLASVLSVPVEAFSCCSSGPSPDVIVLPQLATEHHDVAGSSTATHFKVLQHDPMHRHRCFPGVPSLAWTYPWLTIPPELYLLQHRYNRGHRCFGVSCSHVDSSTGHSAFNLSAHRSSSLSRTAAQKQQQCPGYLPAQTHCHCCCQTAPRHSRVR